jgi:hypothetical protein
MLDKQLKAAAIRTEKLEEATEMASRGKVEPTEAK